MAHEPEASRDMDERKIGSDTLEMPPAPNKGNAGKGRPKGATNKLTADLRGMILGALEAQNGQAYFERVARDDPKTFCMLVAKLLPTTLAADPDAPLPVTSIKIELVRPKHDRANETAT